jgi:hypothetical protein
MAFMGMVMVVGVVACNKKNSGVTKQEESSGAVTLYNSSLEELESSWTYDESGEMVFLDFAYSLPMIGAYTFAFTDDADISGPGLTAFRNAVDKAIEWSAVAKENKVQDTAKQIGDAEILRIPYWANGRYTPNTFMLLEFYFRVFEWEGKNETLLLIRYDMQNINNGLYIAFKEKDFKHLKNILSAESLAKARNEAQEKAKTEDLFN